VTLQDSKVHQSLYKSYAGDSRLSQTTKLNLCKLLIQSFINYAARVWSYICETDYLKLQVVQNKRL